MASRVKDVLIATRVTPRIKEIVDLQAAREGLYVSEWVRMLIVNELNSKDLLSRLD